MNCKVLIAGGSQETYSFAQTGVDDPAEKRLSTIGKAFPGNEIKIVNEEEEEVSPGEIGQLFVRGAATSSGYFGDVEATRTAWGEIGKEGWYRTGDLATLDELGYLILVGRKKDMILRGGQNIYPKEIENLLLSHAKIKDALVIGIPDQVMGERVCACVTLAGRHEFTLEEMVSYLKVKGLAVHKLPERIEVFEQFPTLVDGQKVDKRSVIDRIVKKPEDTR
jgi:non-ribosomal peptide synthetase component E (peptide arylation enzyme)